MFLINQVTVSESKVTQVAIHLQTPALVKSFSPFFSPQYSFNSPEHLCKGFGSITHYSLLH